VEGTKLHSRQFPVNDGRYLLSALSLMLWCVQFASSCGNVLPRYIGPSWACDSNTFTQIIYCGICEVTDSSPSDTGTNMHLCTGFCSVPDEGFGLLWGDNRYVRGDDKKHCLTPAHEVRQLRLATHCKREFLAARTLILCLLTDLLGNALTPPFALNASHLGRWG